MYAIFAALVTAALMAISLALVIGISLGIGWMLTLFLPFSLFEGTLLGMIAGLVTGTLWYKFIRSEISSEPDEEEDDSEAGEIPEFRFWSTNAEKTWENWFRYLIANSVYEDLLESPHCVEASSEDELQKLSIRMADAAVGILREKTSRARRLRVSKGRLKHEMVKMGHPLFDEGVLDAVVPAVNSVLMQTEEVLRRIVRGQLWDEQASVG